MFAGELTTLPFHIELAGFGIYGLFWYCMELAISSLNPSFRLVCLVFVSILMSFSKHLVIVGQT